MAYAGLLVLTYWLFRIAPTGFVPDQDQGRVIANVQLPDSSSLQPDAGGCRRFIDKIARERRRRGGTHDHDFGHVVRSVGDQFQFRIDVHRAETIRGAKGIPDLHDTAIMAQLPTGSLG